MKIFVKTLFLSLAFLFFACSENTNFEQKNTGFLIEAPKQTADMNLIARGHEGRNESSTQPSLILTANLKNAKDNSVIDVFTTTCVPEQIISVQLKGNKWDEVFVEIKFSDIKHTDLIWAYGKSDSFVLEDKQTDISVELEYYDLAFYLTQNPFELFVTDEDRNEITQKSNSGSFVVKSNDELTVEILGLDIFGEVDDSATAPLYSISWTLNGNEIGELNDSGDFIHITTSPISLIIGEIEGVLPQNNVLQAYIDITGVGKFNASFIFDVELN
jgi:hypothetical protein